MSEDNAMTLAVCTEFRIPMRGYEIDYAAAVRRLIEFRIPMRGYEISIAAT